MCFTCKNDAGENYKFDKLAKASLLSKLGLCSNLQANGKARVLARVKKLYESLV